MTGEDGPYSGDDAEYNYAAHAAQPEDPSLSEMIVGELIIKDSYAAVEDVASRREGKRLMAEDYDGVEQDYQKYLTSENGPYSDKATTYEYGTQNDAYYKLGDDATYSDYLVASGAYSDNEKTFKYGSSPDMYEYNNKPLFDGYVDYMMDVEANSAFVQEYALEAYHPDSHDGFNDGFVGGIIDLAANFIVTGDKFSTTDSLRNLAAPYDGKSEYYYSGYGTGRDTFTGAIEMGVFLYSAGQMLKGPGVIDDAIQQRSTFADDLLDPIDDVSNTIINTSEDLGLIVNEPVEPLVNFDKVYKKTNELYIHLDNNKPNAVLYELNKMSPEEIKQVEKLTQFLATQTKTQEQAWVVQNLQKMLSQVNLWKVP